jgi:hypothetical protein
MELPFNWLSGSLGELVRRPGSLPPCGRHNKTAKKRKKPRKSLKSVERAACWRENKYSERQESALTGTFLRESLPVARGKPVVCLLLRALPVPAARPKKL